MNYQKLFLFLLLTVFSAGMMHGQSDNTIVITADANADAPMEVTVQDEEGNSTTVSIAAGESYSPPAGSVIGSVKGQGTVSLGNGIVISLPTSTTSIALSTDSTSGDTGVQATSGTVTITNTTTQESITIVSTTDSGGTGDSFVAISSDGTLTSSTTVPSSFTPNNPASGSGTTTPTTPTQNVISPS